MSIETIGSRDCGGKHNSKLQQKNRSVEQRTKGEQKTQDQGEICLFWGFWKTKGAEGRGKKATCLEGPGGGVSLNFSVAEG